VGPLAVQDVGNAPAWQGTRLVLSREDAWGPALPRRVTAVSAAATRRALAWMRQCEPRSRTSIRLGTQ
jgi:hypothetical protein